LSTTDAIDERTYHVHGQIFFASTERFVQAFDYQDQLKQVKIDFTHAHLWDTSAVSALDRVVAKFRKRGTLVTIIGLNDASTSIVSKFALHDKSDLLEQAAIH
jgi:sulfate permease, SulP family